MEAHKKATPRNARISARMIAWIAAAVFIAALVISLCISISACRNIQQRYTAARNRTGESVYQNLYMLLRKNDETTLSGADIEDSVLPAMREYFISARALNETLTDAYGARYSVLTADQINALEKAFSTYDLAFNVGKSTADAQNALNAALQPIEEILLERYDADGRLLPLP